MQQLLRNCPAPAPQHEPALLLQLKLLLLLLLLLLPQRVVNACRYSCLLYHLYLPAQRFYQGPTRMRVERVNVLASNICQWGATDMLHNQCRQQKRATY